jgi:hypothetical protein
VVNNLSVRPDDQVLVAFRNRKLLRAVISYLLMRTYLCDKPSFCLFNVIVYGFRDALLVIVKLSSESEDPSPHNYQ